MGSPNLGVFETKPEMEIICHGCWRNHPGWNPMAYQTQWIQWPLKFLKHGPEHVQSRAEEIHESRGNFQWMYEKLLGCSTNSHQGWSAKQLVLIRGKTILGQIEGLGPRWAYNFMWPIQVIMTFIDCCKLKVVGGSYAKPSDYFDSCCNSAPVSQPIAAFNEPTPRQNSAHLCFHLQNGATCRLWT